MKKTVRDVDVNGKKILLRADLNVPLKDGKVADDTRIRESLPTIQYLRENGARIIICSHLGRPKGKVDEQLRLDPVANRLSDYLGMEVVKVDDIIDGEVSDVVAQLEKGDVLVLENTRFHAGEKSNDEKFARKLAGLADLYVNDAFGSAHRAHASTEGVAHFLPAVSGLLMAREIHVLEKILQEPKKPFAAILGGAKVSDKIEVVGRLLKSLDILLIGGGMANTFLKARGVSIGESKFEEEHLKIAENIMNEAGQRLFLPVDVIAADRFDEKAATKTVSVDAVPEGWVIMDIGPKTIKLFKEKLAHVKMVVWNGPLGVSEMAPFSKGTMAVAKILADLPAVTIIGGGDSAAAISQAGLAEKMTHISTGGGAFLNFLEGKPLPGIAALADRS